MIDPDKLHFPSSRYRDLLERIGDGIDQEGLELEAGNSIEACKHGLRVWHNLLQVKWDANFRRYAQITSLFISLKILITCIHLPANA
ncbi:MAG: hypothetical protein AMJ95_10350 [Omnitrophica WOR_2 bacterium SM23_72]|nr:MAG: hypothetical protein AMJ95_10350 [Omnitrophica WOR_2 bacterium SM23_72]